ncbi:MAG: hypothetical protein ACTSVE_04960, partial [Candidatus Helarchaeota archaeon]
NNKYTITNVDIDNFTIGTHYINVTVQLKNYTTISRLIPIVIRVHSAELDYEPLGSIPYGENATLTIRFRDIDTLNYPDLNLTSDLYILNNDTQMTVNFGAITSYGDDSYRYYEISDVNISSWTIGTYTLNVTVANSSYDTKTRFITFSVRPRYTTLAINYPAGIVAFGNYATIEILWTDDDLEGSNGINATYGTFNISLMYGNENWLEQFPQAGSPNPINSTAWWEYGTTAGIYIIHVNTSWLPTIGTFDFTIIINHTSGFYQNNSVNTTITTRFRNTYLTVDTFQSPVYGENLSLYARFYDMDNVSGDLDEEEEIKGVTLSFVQPGVYGYYNETSPYYTIVVNTSEFITTNKNEVNNLNLTLLWSAGTKPFYLNQSINVSIICRMIDTYHNTYFNLTKTESYSGWDWGSDLNISIWYYYYFYGKIANMTNCYIDIEAPEPYSDLTTNMTLWGYNGTHWNNISSTKFVEQGFFRIELNASAPENNIPYVFNVTLYKSTDSDEMFRNQTFQISVSFKKPFTALSITYDPDVYVPWGTNMTLRILYFASESGDPVNDPNAVLSYTIMKIEGNTSNVDIQQIPITVIKDAQPGYWNITMNTTWTENYTWEPGAIPRVFFRIDATALFVSDAWQETSIYIREIRARLDFVNGSSLVYTDIPEILYFNATYRYIDVDSGQPIDAYGTTEGRYANITFWSWDTINSLYNDSNWGVWNGTHYYGQFNVTSLGNGYYKFNFSFIRNMSTNGPYQMKIVANGTHLRGPSIDQVLAINLDYWVTLRLRWHETNITFNKDDMPQVPEWSGEWTPINTTSPNEIIYGDEFNITLFWYDLDVLSPFMNDTGISFGAYNLTATIDPIWGSTEVHLLGAYTLYNMYIVENNDTYRGIYIIEFDTGFFLRNYEFYDLINGGPLNDGTYNLTIRFWLTGEAFDPEYKLAEANITVKILPVPTQIYINKYIMGGIEFNKTVNGTIVPFGTTSPDSLYYTTEFNFTDSYRASPISPIGVFSSMVEVYFENYTGGTPNGMLVPWTPIYFDKGTGQYKVRIFTDTQWILNNDWIPFNATGYKEVNVSIRIAKPNYKNATAVMLIAFRKHETRIAYYKQFQYEQPESPFNETIIGYNHEDTIYFKYIDQDAAITGSETYIQLGSVISNWTFDWGRIEEIATDRGWYRIILDANTNFNVGTYYFTINASDSLGFRANASVAWKAIIIQAKTDFNLTLDKSEVYQFIEQIVVRVHYEDEFGQVITDATIRYTLIQNGKLIASGYLTNVGDGNYIARIDTIATNIGLFNLTINATPSSTNFEGKEKWTNVVITSIFLHPLSVTFEIIAAGIVGFAGYHQVKWILTPYVVKQIVKTRKSVNKRKDLKEIEVVRDRKELFKEEFAEEWAQLNLKPPSMVSSEIIAFTNELSNIKRSRITTAEAKRLINELKSMSKEEADAYLEKELMIPPEARRRLLKSGGIIEVQKPEVVKLMDLLVQIKEKPYTYDYCDELYSRLIKMKPEDASNLLWNQLLISSTDRITILQAIGIPVGKLKKKIKKELAPLSEKEIKRELKRYPELSVEQKQRELERILRMQPKQQRKYIGELKRKHIKKDEKRRQDKEAKEAAKGLTEDQIEKELKNITSLSDADKKLMKESLLLLPPEERESTLDMMKKQFEGKTVENTEEKEKSEETKSNNPPKEGGNDS